MVFGSLSKRYIHLDYFLSFFHPSPIRYSVLHVYYTVLSHEITGLWFDYTAFPQNGYETE